MGSLLGGIFDFLGGAVVSALETFVVWLFQLIVLVFQVLWQVIQGVAKFLLKTQGDQASMTDLQWTDGWHGFFSSLWDSVKKIWAKIGSSLASLLTFLSKLRKALERYYNTYIRPMLLMIQHIRQFLQILTALHIGFAQKLDSWLAQIQNKINQAFATVIGTINTLTDIANAIMDPLSLLRKPVLLLSIRRKIPALIRVLTGKPAWYFFPSPRGSKGGVYGVPSGPFNFADTNQNPLASTLLGTDDGIENVSLADATFQFAPGNVDQADVLDYFNDDLYPDKGCPNDPSKCLLRGWGVING